MRAERNSISKSSLALHNLRGFTILMVVAAHSTLPLDSGIKFAIVSSGVLVLSWAESAGVSRAAEAIGLLPGQLPGQPPAIRASTRAFARSNLWSSSG